MPIPIPSGFRADPKYGFVGPKYQRYGEREGWVYLPMIDDYVRPHDSARIQDNAERYNEYVAEAEKQKKLQDLQYEKDIKNLTAKPPGLFEQMAPIAVATSVPVAISKGADSLFPSAADKLAEAKIAEMTAKTGAAGGLIPASGYAGQALAPVWGTPTAGALAPSAVSGEASSAVGGLIDKYASGAETEGAGLLAANPVLQGAVGAAGLGLGGYGMYNAYESGDPLSGGLSGATAGYGTALLGEALGISALTGIGLPLAIGGAILGLGLGAFGGSKSEGDYNRERWGAVAANNPRWGEVRNKIESERRADNDTWTAETDPTGKHVGKKWSWDSVKDIVRTTGNYDPLMLTIGHAQAFGDRWHELSMEKRREFMEKAFKEGLYTYDNGAIFFSEKHGKLDRAKKLMEELLGKPFEQMTDEELNSAQAPEYRYEAREPYKPEEEKPVGTPSPGQMAVERPTAPGGGVKTPITTPQNERPSSNLMNTYTPPNYVAPTNPVVLGPQGTTGGGVITPIGGGGLMAAAPKLTTPTPTIVPTTITPTITPTPSPGLLNVGQPTQTYAMPYVGQPTWLDPYKPVTAQQVAVPIPVPSIQLPVGEAPNLKERTELYFGS